MFGYLVKPPPRHPVVAQAHYEYEYTVAVVGRIYYVSVHGLRSPSSRGATASEMREIFEKARTHVHLSKYLLIDMRLSEYGSHGSTED